jgi:hypothetical protein
LSNVHQPQQSAQGVAFGPQFVHRAAEGVAFGAEASRETSPWRPRKTAMALAMRSKRDKLNTGWTPEDDSSW